MANYNRVILMGNLTRDVELRHLQNGTAVADVSIAVNERKKTASGEWIEETSFFDVTMWGRTAEVASQYMSKGKPMLIEGRLRQERWEKDGQKRSKVKIICDKMQMLGSPNGGGRAAGVPQSNQYSEPATVSSSSAAPPADDIPF